MARSETQWMVEVSRFLRTNRPYYICINVCHMLFRAESENRHMTVAEYSCSTFSNLFVRLKTRYFIFLVFFVRWVVYSSIHANEFSPPHVPNSFKCKLNISHPDDSHWGYSPAATSLSLKMTSTRPSNDDAFSHKPALYASIQPTDVWNE